MPYAECSRYQPFCLRLYCEYPGTCSGIMCTCIQMIGRIGQVRWHCFNKQQHAVHAYAQERPIAYSRHTAYFWCAASVIMFATSGSLVLHQPLCVIYVHACQWWPPQGGDCTNALQDRQRAVYMCLLQYATLHDVECGPDDYAGYWVCLHHAVMWLTTLLGDKGSAWM